MSHDHDMDASTGSHTQLYVVIKAFKARLDDELTINEGDKIDLISDDSEFDDGWYMGKNLTTGKVGLYPKVFTQIQKDPVGDPDGSKPSLLRSRSRRTAQNSPVSAYPPPSPSNVFRNSNGSKANHQFSDSHSFMNTSNASSSSIPHSALNNKRTSSVNRYVNDIDNALKELNINESSVISEDISAIKNVNGNADVIDWSPAQVAEHFAQIVDDETAAKFIIHKISGRILLELHLSHLKELEIDSFGTRYEIYREIEKLRTSKPISTPTDLSNQSDFSSSTTNYKQTPHLQNHEYSKLARSTPSPVALHHNFETPGNRESAVDEVQLNHQHHHNHLSETMKLNPPLAGQPNGEQFASPRRAPRPPSYPSPVANNPTKFGIRSPEKSKFGADILPRLMTNPASHSRNSSMSVGNASSIYVDTASPSRRPSIVLPESSEPHMKKSDFVAKSQSSSSEDVKDIASTTLIKPASDRRSVSAKEFKQILKNKDLLKRVHSDTIPPSASSAATAAAAAAAATNENDTSNMTTLSPPPIQSKSSFRNFVSGSRNNKSNTSAFQEGIRTTTPDEALQNSDFAGWMFKRGNLTIGSWKHRFFTLHGTRLSYYVTTKDTKERGLIDITAHRVLPATEAEDKISAVYAASAGYGRYCFKLVPPAPGARSGLTFTQQKVHYFAVETREEMRSWMSALMKATIELDESVPAISSCVTPTIPLQRAQELMAVARESARENFDNMQKLRTENKGYDVNSDDNSLDSPTSPPFNGMATPYMMTSGILNSTSSGINGSSNALENTPARMASVKMHAPMVTRLDDANENDDDKGFEPPSTLAKSQSFSKRLRSLRRSSKD